MPTIDTLTIEQEAVSYSCEALLAHFTTTNESQFCSLHRLALNQSDYSKPFSTVRYHLRRFVNPACKFFGKHAQSFRSSLCDHNSNKCDKCDKCDSRVITCIVGLTLAACGTTKLRIELQTKSKWRKILS